MSFCSLSISLSTYVDNFFLNINTVPIYKLHNLYGGTYIKTKLNNGNIQHT
jgi:hypothetical protein